MTEVTKIKWNCTYCGKPQETTDLPTIEGQTPYRDRLLKNAKDGTVACWSCFQRILRSVKRF